MGPASDTGFGISHPFAAVLLGHDPETDTIYVLHSYRVRNALPMVHARHILTVAPQVPVAWPHDGHQRDKGSGEDLAGIYRKEGLLMLPTHATFRSGGYSTEAGYAEMLQRMTTDRFKIALGMPEWVQEFEELHRVDGLVVRIGDDLMSATRIGAMQIRSAKPVGLGSGRNYATAGRGWAGGDPRRQSGMARNVDFDVFDP